MRFSHCNAVVMCLLYLNRASLLLAGFDSSGTFAAQSSDLNLNQTHVAVVKSESSVSLICFRCCRTPTYAYSKFSKEELMMGH